MIDEEKLIKLAAQKHEIKLSSQDILQKYELEQQSDAKKKRWIFSRPMLYTSGTILTVCLLAVLIIPNVSNANDPTSEIGVNSVVDVDSEDVISESTTPVTTSISGDSTQLAIAPGTDNEVVGFEILSSAELFDETSDTTTNSANLTTIKARGDDYPDDGQGTGSSHNQEASFEDVVNSYEKIENIVYQASNLKDGIASSVYEGSYEGTYDTYTFKVVYQDSDIVLYYNVSEETEDNYYSDTYYYRSGGIGYGDGDGDGDGEGDGNHQNANNHFGSKFYGEIVLGDKTYQTSGIRETDENDEFENINLQITISDSKYYIINQMSDEGGFNYDYLLYENKRPICYYGISVTTFYDDTFICSATIQYSEGQSYDFFVTQEGDYFDLEYRSRRDYRIIYLYYSVDGHRYVDQDTNEEIIK